MPLKNETKKRPLTSPTDTETIHEWREKKKRRASTLEPRLDVSVEHATDQSQLRLRSSLITSFACLSTLRHAIIKEFDCDSAFSNKTRPDLNPLRDGCRGQSAY